ncbi:MAG: hypothetical protein ACTHZW_09630 [Microbacteriaceae bacterium]
MSAHTPDPPLRKRSLHPTRWSVAPVFGFAAAIAVALIVLAFVWPASASQSQRLPVGIAGPDDAVSALEDKTAEQDPAPFDFVDVDDRADAVERVQSREIYGAILLGDEPEVLVASGAGTVPAQALRGVATQVQLQIDASAQKSLTDALQSITGALASGQPPQVDAEAPGPRTIPTVEVTDLVPLADGDRTGSGLPASVFPMVLGGMLGGVLLTLLVQGVVRRLSGLVVFALAAGALMALVMQTWFGILQGDWLVNAAVMGLGVAATASVVIGFAALIGPAGIGVGAVITMFIANPIAGATAPAEFLPQPWGDIGQYFVPGASAHLLRSVVYFPDAVTGTQWVVLAAWTVGGVILALLGHWRTQAEIAPPARQLEA